MSEREEPAVLGAHSRRRFLALAGGSAATAAFLVACGDDGGDTETAQFGDGDAGILNYLLMLEHLEADLFAEMDSSGLFAGTAGKTVRELGQEEEDHVAALSKAVERLEAEVEPRPATRFRVTNANAALEQARDLENLVAGAYLGQLPKIEREGVLTTALSIHSIEGRHAGAVNKLLGEPAAPDGAFAKPAPASAVLKRVEPFLAA